MLQSILLPLAVIDERINSRLASVPYICRCYTRWRAMVQQDSGGEYGTGVEVEAGGTQHSRLSFQGHRLMLGD